MMASISKRGDSWQYRVSYKDINGEYHTTSQGGFRSKSAAKLAASKVEIDASYGAKIDHANITLIEYWDRWLSAFKLGKHSNATESHYPGIRKALLSYFGPNTRIKDITRSDYQTFLNAYAAGTVVPRHKPKNHVPKKRARGTVRNLHQYVKAMAASAMDDLLISRNFANNISIPGSKGKDTALKYLQVSDYKKLKKYCYSHADMTHMYNYVIAAGVDTGARFAEVIGLTWPDIDFENKTISITKTWDWLSGGGFKATKTLSSVRTIEVTDDLLQLLRQLHRQQNEYFMRHGFRDPDQLVFMSYRHSVLRDGTINADLRRLLPSLGISPVITFHGLRHTHVSYLLSQGVDINYISHRLGHADVTITLRVYSHLLDVANKQQSALAVKALSNL